MLLPIASRLRAISSIKWKANLQQTAVIKIKSKKQLECMRVSGEKTAFVRDGLAAIIDAGISTQDLDAYAAELIKKTGGKSAFLGYRGYPGNVCVSVNDEVVHGIPGGRVVRSGDIVTVDVGVEYDGFIGDSATTVMVAVEDPEVIRLVDVTRTALMAGIEKAVAGARVSDISHAVERVVVAAGFAVVRDFVGHGVGKKLHEDPQIPNFGPPGKGAKLKAGMTLAIEPMVNLGTHKVEVMDNNWTVVTVDRRPSAHFEHTVAVREGPAEILTWSKKKE